MNTARKFEEIDKRMSKLAKLSASLTLQDMATKDHGNVTYLVDSGMCTGKALFNSQNTSIQRIEIKAGTIFPRHNHGESVEFLIVVKGRIINTSDNEEKKIIYAGECIRIDKHVSHSVEAKEDTILIAIAIPPSEGFPNA